MYRATGFSRDEVTQTSARIATAQPELTTDFPFCAAQRTVAFFRRVQITPAYPRRTYRQVELAEMHHTF